MTFALLCTWSVLNAVPVKPEVREHVQSDGTTIRVRPVGDEWHHGFVTADDGLTLSMASNGDFYYKTTSGVSQIMAHNQGSRSSAENTFVAANKDLMTMAAQVSAAAGPRRARAAAPPRKVGATQVPVTGSPRVPIILVEYKDKKMSNTMEAFMEQYTNGANSVLQYFTDQSNGKYTPQFDLYGIYTLNNNRSVYGGNSGSDDVGVARMVGEAIDMAGDDIDWSLYDNDDDGEADVCIVVYAGVGEAQAYGIVMDAVWPCQWSLSSASYYYGDGTGSRTRNGVTIDRFAVFNEVGGSNDNGTQIDGIGTFCHEFSHCLGLPDFYETTYDYGYFGMGDWSLMDHGCYNGSLNGVDGTCPIGYSAYEKSFMGWVTLKTPVAGTHYNLPIWNAKSAETDVAYNIVSPKTSNEYFILENRRKQGWDAEIQDEGMLIEHVSYISSRWNDNSVNNQSVQLMTIIPADNDLSMGTQDADCYGRTNHNFTDSAAVLNMSNSYSANGNAGYLGKPVTDIYINNDGTVGFWYIKPDIPTLDAPVLAEATDVQSTSFTASWEHTPAVNCTYTLELTPVTLELLLEETFAKCNAAGTADISSSLDNVTDVAGWTGSRVYKAQGGLKLGSNQYTGTLVSPVIDAGDHEKVSVKFKAKANGSSTNVGLTVSYGSQSTDITLPSNAEVEYVVLFDKEASQSVSFATKAKRKAAVITQVQVYGGDVTQAGHEEPYRTITGITEKQYTVTDLEPGTYSFRVKAIPDDENAAAESDWSNVETVTLVMSYLRGDVNGDGEVGIADITALITLILDGESNERSDVNEDGETQIADITALITIVLDQE